MRLNTLEDDDAPVVLIVDDVPENLAVLHDTLDETGHTVLVALDGETALARARQAQPDVVLLGCRHAGHGWLRGGSPPQGQP